MKNIEQQPNNSNLQSLETELSLTKAEMEEFRKLPKEEQEKQKDEKLEKLKALQQKLDEAIQEAIQTGNIEEVKILKENLNKEITDLEAVFRIIESEIQVNYTYTNKETGEVERQEIIDLDFESNLIRWTDFYKKHGIELPVDFAEIMQGIWSRNNDEIKKQIEILGFDKVLFITESLEKIGLKELITNMTLGYIEEAKKNGKPESDVYIYRRFDLDKIVNSRQGNRIVLLHSATNVTVHPELLNTLKKDISGEKLDGNNNKAAYFVKQGEQLTLSEWFILQRQVWEETSVHIDCDGCVICPGSCYSSIHHGLLVPYVGWDEDKHNVFIQGDMSRLSDSLQGCRISRSFS